jgi:hypothetical protein
VTGGVTVPVHFAEKFVADTPETGAVSKLLNFTCRSVRVATGVPDSVVFA